MQVHLRFWALMAVSIQSIIAAPAAPGAAGANVITIKKASALKIESNVLVRNCDLIQDPISRKRVSGQGELFEVLDELEKLVVLAEASTKAAKGQKKTPFDRLFKPTAKPGFMKTLKALKNPPAKKGAAIIFCRPDEYFAPPLKKTQTDKQLDADDGYFWGDSELLKKTPGNGEEHPHCKPGSAYYIEPFTNRIHLCKAFWKSAKTVNKVCPGPETRANDLRGMYRMPCLFVITKSDCFSVSFDECASRNAIVQRKQRRT
jgi:hypothetical protein